MRSQPGIFESGSPPSVPFNFLNRATRFIIVLRDMPRRGSVSLYSMIASYLMLHNNSRRSRYESSALADPAAELPACALALDATFVVAGKKGERRIPAQDFFKGLYATALKAGELLVAAEFPLP